MERLRLGKHAVIVTTIAVFVAVVVGASVLTFFLAASLPETSKVIALTAKMDITVQRLAAVDASDEISPVVKEQLTALQKQLASDVQELTVVLNKISNTTDELMSTATKATDVTTALSSEILDILKNPQHTEMFARATSVAEKATKVAVDRSQRSFNSLTKKLRLLQLVTIGFSLAALAVVILGLIRNLRGKENAVDQARRETAQILNTVNEGLFLLDQERNIGSAFSGCHDPHI